MELINIYCNNLHVNLLLIGNINCNQDESN